VREDTQWYPRLGNVPGISFAGSPGVNRSTLPDASKRPSLQYGTLYWETADGTTSASPAHQVTYADGDVDAKTLVKRTWEGLELPGVVTDWHFLLMGTASALWNKRRTDPEFLTECEAFCRLDLQVVATHPDLFIVDRESDHPEYLSIPSFTILVKLLRAVDDLHEALRIAREGAKFNPGSLDQTVVQLEAQLLERA
jgi:hypothetical protein